jgi:hypothetical protein
MVNICADPLPLAGDTVTACGGWFPPLGATVTDTVLVTPLAAAVTDTVFVVVTVAAVPVKAAVVALAPTVTVAGTGSAASLLDRLTVSPPAEAAFVSVTVQVVVCPDDTLAGAQVTDDNCAGDEALNVNVFDTPAALAVNNAV